MILLGIDDTDTLDDPGTNQLARHLVRELVDEYRALLVTRHQLLEDPRVPCTKKNGCAAIELAPLGTWSRESLTARVRSLMLAWCPRGSDPGLCVAVDPIPEDVIAHGRACQTRLVTQAEARELAVRHGMYLEGLGGTEDGVIGALAAVGLLASRNDGRVVFLSEGFEDRCDVTGVQAIDEVLSRGVQEVRCRIDDRPIDSGRVDLGKRLRPNYRNGKVVLYVSPARHAACDWVAERVV
jgi:tRNA(Ile2) C34 agmatinyltransferase TiaS